MKRLPTQDYPIIYYARSNTNKIIINRENVTMMGNCGLCSWIMYVYVVNLLLHTYKVLKFLRTLLTIVIGRYYDVQDSTIDILVIFSETSYLNVALV